jgi:hypothetical protein
MAESALPNGLPYPTPTRLRLADAIAANQVKHYHWVKPWSCDIVRDANVTARVAELVAAGLAEIPDHGEPESMVRLTPGGMAWVTRARTSKISTEGEGPGSTSPEPGPPPELRDEVRGLLAGLGDRARRRRALDAIADELNAGLADPLGAPAGSAQRARDAAEQLPTVGRWESGHSTEDGAR